MTAFPAELWQQIAAEYITGDLSYEKLAQKYNMKRHTVCRKALEEKWGDQRKAYREKVYQSVVENTQKETSEKLKDLLTAAEGLAQLLSVKSPDTENFMRTDPNTMKNFVDFRAVKDAASAIQILTQVKRSLCGILTANEAAQQRIANERLALDREKFEYEKKRNDEEGQAPEFVVTIQGGEDYCG